MKQRTYRTLIVLVVALSLLTSACFQIRMFKISPRSASPGETTTLTIKAFPLSISELTNGGRPFVLIGYESADLSLSSVSDFDTTGNFGGPFTRVSDNVLRNLLRTAGECIVGVGGIEPSDVTDPNLTWVAYRTTGQVNSSIGTLHKKFIVKLRFTRTVASSDNDRGDVVVFMGHWADVGSPGNGVPDSGEGVCTSVIFSSIPFNT